MSKAYLLKKKKERIIGMVPENLELCYQVFFEKFSNRLEIKNEEKHYLKELNKIVKAHNESHAEIKRGDSYVIFLSNFQTVTVDSANIKKYLSIANKLFNKLEGEF